MLILAGDHIYKMDYGNMIAAHVANGADVTVGCLAVPLEEAKAFGVMAVDTDDRIVEFAEKPDNPKSMPGDDTQALASMGIYVFSTRYLRERLVKDAVDVDSKHDFGHNIIPGSIGKDNIFSFRFINANTGATGYWRDVGNIDAYWDATMDLLHVTPERNM